METPLPPPDIHPTAVVHDGAELAPGVVIGPYAVVESGVSIGPGTRIGAHSVCLSKVRIGARNRIHAHVVLGDAPQDMSFLGGETWLEIGDENVIREKVTVHRSTNPERPTRIGSRCYLMCYSHVAHDCQLGDRVILTNNVGLSGHISIGDGAVLGGMVGVHQFTRIGTLAMVAGFVGVRKDVMPFTLLGGPPVRHYRLNTIGLRRAGITGDRYQTLQRAYRQLRAGSDLQGLPDTPEIALLRDWLAAPSKRGVYPCLRHDRGAEED